MLIIGVLLFLIPFVIYSCGRLLYFKEKLVCPVNETMDHQPTEVGEWKLISTLGSGSFGTVTLWRERNSLETVAVKKCKYLRPSSLTQKQKDRWNKEVDFLKSVKHPNIIAFKALEPVLADLLNKHNPTKLPLLPMEYCTKGNLRRYLSSEYIKLCGLAERDVRDIIRDVSNGLSYLHLKKITHRDIKPDNIVLQHCDDRKSRTMYKIIDLGYAKELQDTTLSFVGTLHYLAPEIFYNKEYDYRVDYWSVGTMVFELICGILPFLPEYTPFERFEKIKNKGPDDICIYVTRSGSVSNSTEIKREHFISSCLKQNLEQWLRRALQMDPNNRTFHSDLSAFDYLRYILDKNIIQVFSVHKLESYSYEVNDCTLFGTLKDWISRDIKVPKTDLLFLFGQKPKKNVDENTNGEVQHDNINEESATCNDDSTLLQCLASNEDVILYVFKKDAVLHEKCLKPKLPNLLKDLFTSSNFSPKLLKRVFRLALFHIYMASHTKANFEMAYLCLIQHINDLSEKIKQNYVNVTSEFGQLLAEVQNFLQNRNKLIDGLRTVDLEAFPKYRDCLKYCLRIISSIERREIYLKDFGKQYQKLARLKLSINGAKKDVAGIFKEYNIQSKFDKINGQGFLKEFRNGETVDVVLKPVKDVLSDTLKLEHGLYFKDQRLKNYSEDLCTILKWSEQLLGWLDDFKDNIVKLSTEFGNVRDVHDKIVSEARRKARLDDLKFDVRKTEKIIKENELVRCQFIDFISAQIAELKDFAESSKEYLD